MFKMDHYICFMFSFGSAYHIFQKNTKYKTHFYTCVHFFKHFYTFLHMCKHMCKWFFGLHMCKWIFWVYTCVIWFFLTYTFLHILTHPYTSIRIQVYSSLFGSCFRTMTSYDMLFNPSKWLRSNGLHIFLHFLQWTYAW
jgi:hypothetical protein